MENTLKPVIRLYDAIGLGVIINYPTGVLISNQTGGTACLHPSIEGIYLPLCNDYYTETLKLISPETDLNEYFTNEKHYGTGATHGLDEEDVEHITTILSKYHLDDLIKIDTSKLERSHEAWIYINIHNNDHELLSNFGASLTGVLTWTNSD